MANPDRPERERKPIQWPAKSTPTPGSGAGEGRPPPVAKPPPIRQAESAPGGLGVLLDDLVAGLVAAGAVLGMTAGGLLP